jgi:NAD(P)-dependent dehydrogenase (short-subunit alcohol dehydrogenase family)
MSHIVLTGASAGIGAAAAVELTRQGHTVLAVGRSPAKLAAIAARMRTAAQAGHEVPEPIAIDLAAQAGVRELADRVLDRVEVLDVLVNNAGVQPVRRELSPDGVELALAVNHLAPFLLTALLTQRLRDSGGRVVTTSSSTHLKAGLDLADLQLEHQWSTAGAYGRSKLANVLFTAELGRRTGLPATSFHPGTISTDLNRDAAYARWLKPLEGLVMSTPRRGADTLVWLATSAEGGAPTALYYRARRPAPTNPLATDQRLAAELWQRSAALVGNRQPDSDVRP